MIAPLSYHEGDGDVISSVVVNIGTEMVLKSYVQHVRPGVENGDVFSIDPRTDTHGFEGNDKKIVTVVVVWSSNRACDLSRDNISHAV